MSDWVDPTEYEPAEAGMTKPSILPKVSTALEVCGIAAIVAGCFVLALWLGLIALGAALVLCGFAIDPAG